MSDDNGAQPGLPTDPLDSATDPWQYMEKVRGMDLQDRAPRLQKWLELVQRRPAHERDALITQGREVWKYRMETARSSMREMEEVAHGLSRTCVTLATKDYLAETVYRPGT